MSRTFKGAAVLLIIILILGGTGAVTDLLVFLGERFYHVFPEAEELAVMNYFGSPYLTAGVLSLPILCIGWWLGKRVVKLICFTAGILILISMLASLGIVVF